MLQRLTKASWHSTDQLDGAECSGRFELEKLGQELPYEVRTTRLKYQERLYSPSFFNPTHQIMKI